MKELVAVQEKTKPKIGFLGVGWIGKNRLEALAKSGLTENFAICDTYSPSVSDTLQVQPYARVKDCYYDLLQEEVEGVVIATPSALHASQSIEALKAGKAVFCQKPLGRNLSETIAVVREAKRGNLLLGVDFSYRFTKGIQALKSIIDEGKLGKVYKVEGVFHNAYGPDKDWFYNPKQSGGGCLIDLGSHMIDLFVYLFKASSLEVEYANILSHGYPVVNPDEQVEDYAEAILSGKRISFQLACSWRLSVGKDADISLKVYGTEGGASFYNTNGSFYDFKLDLHKQNTTETIVDQPDDWGGKAIQEWASKLAEGNHYDEANQELIQTATILEDIYNYRKE